MTRRKSTSRNGNLRDSSDIARSWAAFHIHRRMSCDSKGEELGVGCGDVEVFKVTLTTVSELCHGLDHFVTKQFVSKSREPNLMKKVLSRKITPKEFWIDSTAIIARLWKCPDRILKLECRTLLVIMIQHIHSGFSKSQLLAFYCRLFRFPHQSQRSENKKQIQTQINPDTKFKNCSAYGVSADYVFYLK